MKQSIAAVLSLTRCNALHVCPISSEAVSVIVGPRLGAWKGGWEMAQRRTIACGLMGGVIVLGALGASAQLTERHSTKSALQGTTGRPADGAFHYDLTKGFDDENQVHSNWDINADWLGVAYRPSNARFGANGLSLSARKQRTRISDYTSAEFQIVGFYGYGRYEVVMQAAEAEGVVSAFFVYSGPDMDDPHDEIDFEILGRSPRRAQLNYFGDGQKDPGDIQIWFDATRGQHLYAFEWLPDSITWYADNLQIRRVTAKTGAAPLPRTTGRVMMSVWAANKLSALWAGAPSFEKTTAVFRCVSHVPMGKTGRQCSDTFKPKGA